ncbi:MAG: hypothetical protein PQJ59_13980 [Spirochaetales bacterium]|nr:hypothetical protein [Spirochaetales bacterium]
MNKTNVSIRLQVITTYILIYLAVAAVLFSLGFMTNFFNLFMDGNEEMYNFFKAVQELNNKVFGWSVIALVLSLVYIPFELNKGAAGFFGMIYTILTGLFNGLKGISILGKTSSFNEMYNQIDFSSLADYRVSTMPFTLASVFAVLIMVVSLSLTLLSIINYFSITRRGGSNEA